MALGTVFATFVFHVDHMMSMAAVLIYYSSRAPANYRNHVSAQRANLMFGIIKSAF